MIRVVALAVATLLACGSKPSIDRTAAPTSDDRNRCERADDCTLIAACCGCSAGGRQVAIRKDAVADYDATRTTRCADTTCSSALSVHPSCDAEAICEAGRCRVAPHLGTLPAESDRALPPAR